MMRGRRCKVSVWKDYYMFRYECAQDIQWKKAMTDSLNMRFHILMEALLLTKYFIRPSNIPNMNNAAVSRRPFSTCQMLLIIARSIYYCSALLRMYRDL